ncbi:hypothetical protein ERJ75_001446000 [Trypanosoma vivax]|nr:hypothetical protein ERJ75_001446000 [Trypanosoma vivax]
MDLPVGRSTQHTLGHAKSFQETNGVLAAENGLLKAGRVQTATEMRGASAQRSEPNTKQAHRSTVMVSHASKAGERQPPQENNNPLTTNVGFRGIQGLRDELGEAPFEPEEKIRTDEGALEYLMATSPEHLCTACRDTFPMPPKPVFCSKTHWMRWRYGRVQLSEWVSRKPESAWQASL